jgi:hypothetical protein
MFVSLTGTFLAIILMPILRIQENLPPVLFDLDDIEHWLVVRAALDKASSDRRLVRLLHVPPVILAEYRAARLAQRIFVCSELDKLYLQKLGFGKGVICVPNSIDRAGPGNLDSTISGISA